MIFAEKPQIKINRLLKQKHWYLIHTWQEKAMRSSVNWETLYFQHLKGFKNYPDFRVWNGPMKDKGWWMVGKPENSSWLPGENL